MRTTTRNATLTDLATLLQDQQARKVDVVASASKIRFKDGVLHLSEMDPQLDEDGVTLPDGQYVPTGVCDEGLADKLGVPIAYLRRLRKDRPDMYDGNLNGWLHGSRVRTVAPGDRFEQAHPGDSRQFLVRCFKGDDGEPGIARAFLSDRFKTIDNLDVLMACLAGVKEAGVDINIVGADLTDRRMMVRLVAPEVTALAPTLLEGYRSPYGGASGTDNPIVWAGLQIANSETGGGAFTIVPRIQVQVCKNGLTIIKDAVREVHLGGKLDAGVVRWSDETQEANVHLITAKTRDAVATFLDVDYMQSVIAGIEEKAGTPIHRVDDVKVLTKRLAFSQAETDSILDHFIRGGQMTFGGVLNAITSVAQGLSDADAAYEMESAALRVLDAA